MEHTLVSNIQRFSLDDGPGTRTTIFLKGCNLKCAWCHNPECISPTATLQFFAEQCTSCGECVSLCPQKVHRITDFGEHVLNRNLCQGCQKCMEACSRQALSVNGTAYTVEELLREIKKDVRFYVQSGGGVTFSGGEPMLQHTFLKEILPLCHENQISVAIDTAGNVPFSFFEELLPYIQYVLYDIKFFSPKIHQEFTGVTNEQILNNLKKLASHPLAPELFIRIPVVKGANASFEELTAIADFLIGIAPAKIELLPYHTYGVKKYSTFGLPYSSHALETPSEEFMQKARNIFLSRGLPAVC